MKAGMEGYKPLPIGVDSFERIREDGYYYVDKTLLIKELLDLKGGVTLFTRPRRFGKTLNMSMLQSFFQISQGETAAARQERLFSGLSIMDAGELYTKEMGQYPVISLSLKSAKQSAWKQSYAILTEKISEEFKRHRCALEALPLLEGDRGRVDRIMNQSGEIEDYLTALQFLSDCLEQYYRRKVIILIDEYDVPLESAYAEGYYKEMVDFIRSLLESALKTNESLAFAVLTGCLRITKESIFTGLNNLEIFSVASYGYAEHFGFTPKEVEEALNFYGKEAYFPEVKEWYDGYLFGDTEVYNPWSVVNHLKQMTIKADIGPKAYWANTSGNAIVRTLIDKADAGVRAEVETLMAGGCIEKPIHEDITYDEVGKDMNNLWNFLYFTGYLTKELERRDAEDMVYATLRIPNREVKTVYRDHVQSWFASEVSRAELQPMYEAILDLDGQKFETELNKLLLGTISYMDSKEAFYHGFLAGALAGMTAQTYQLKSNRESGDGRYDLLLCAVDYTKAIVIELKAVERKTELKAGCVRALAQIADRGYREELLEDGYDEVVSCGVAFWKKQCRVEFSAATEE